MSLLIGVVLCLLLCFVLVKIVLIVRNGNLFEIIKIIIYKILINGDDKMVVYKDVF